MVQLSEELVLELDQEAETRNLSRSALIREILATHLQDRASSSIGRRIVEGYVRVPPGQPDQWGTLEEVSDQATVDLLTRLDSEERASGPGPW